MTMIRDRIRNLPGGGRLRLAVPSGVRLDVVLAGLLAATTAAVHDLHYVFSFPFWADEGWVAISTRLPLSDLPAVTASTPIGWTALLRLVVIGGPERLRAVPLLFAALSVLAAYTYARTLPWPRLLAARVAGVLAGLGALIAPSSLLRDDLKQYTADAFVVLTVLVLVSRWESSPGRRRLVQLGFFTVVAFLFSAATLFAAVAAFTAILLRQLVEKDRAAVVQTALVAGASGTGQVAVYLAFYRRGIPSGLNDYWAAFFVPISAGWQASWQFFIRGMSRMADYLALGPLAVAVVLVTCGVLTLVRLGRPATALAAPVLLVVMVVLGAARQYPLFDLRTSHFLLVMVTVTAALGVSGLVCLLMGRQVTVGLLVAIAAGVLFVVSTHGQFRAQPISTEDVRSPTRYVFDHRRPGDVVVVNELSSWGFAYYWPIGSPSAEPVTTVLQGFIADLPSQPDILVMRDLSAAGIRAILDQASRHIAGRPGARVWYVHEHQHTAEFLAFRAWEKLHQFSHEDPVAALSVLSAS